MSDYPLTACIVTGSTVVYPYNNTTLKPVELGASIFVDVNKNLVRAAKEFNLDVISLEGKEQLGIWDGSTVLVTVRVYPSGILIISYPFP